MKKKSKLPDDWLEYGDAGNFVPWLLFFSFFCSFAPVYLIICLSVAFLFTLLRFMEEYYGVEGKWREWSSMQNKPPLI